MRKNYRFLSKINGFRRKNVVRPILSVSTVVISFVVTKHLTRSEDLKRFEPEYVSRSDSV